MLSPRPRRLLPYVAALGLLSILAVVFRQQLSPYIEIPRWNNPFASGASSNITAFPKPDPEADPHPVVKLLRRAEDDFDALVKKETWDLPAAARRYREVRGRHPPPGFDKWWEYAHQNDAMVVEEFWDQIYHDLNPLWALDQKEMFRDVHSQPPVFKFRNGRVSHENDHFWMDIWKDLFESVAGMLPDMDLSVNTMDESRLLVPAEDMDVYVSESVNNRALVPVDKVIKEFSKVPELLPDEQLPDFPWDRSSEGLWERHAAPCPAHSEARRSHPATNISAPPLLTNAYTAPHTSQGYVSNYTLSTSLCHQPDLAFLHGFLIEPISISTSRKLFPLFGSSKLSVNSEILIPAAMYYKGDERFLTDASPVPWAEKTDTLFWRGLASGGRNTERNWKGFHRHRLISLLNGTQALLMPNSSNFIDIASLPLEPWNLQSWSNTTVPHSVAMGEWLQSFTDVGFNDLACFPREVPPPGGLDCYYTNYIFKPIPSLPLHEIHKNKYLVDVDGNSFSGRYLDFLRSGSLPIKSTLFREWHDSRLIAWKHFVPMDNRFLDIVGIMEFCLGYGREEDGQWRGGRDMAAQRISEEGREWAKKVLRKEDMRVYTLRLLLEYARVMDERREELGWVDDLTGAVA